MRNSQLLINEPPLQVCPSLAVAIGLGESIVVQQVHYWIQNPKSGVMRDGFKWVYNTYEDWKEKNFPFWSISTIARLFTGLEKSGILISAQFDEGDRDMKKYYRIDYDVLDNVNLTPSITSHRRDVKGNTESHSENERFKGIVQSLAELQGGGLRATDADLINTWMEKHEDKYIFNALAIARTKAARSAAYVDSILIGWEANGYPKPREERVKDAKKPAAAKNDDILARARERAQQS